MISIGERAACWKATYSNTHQQILQFAFGARSGAGWSETLPQKKALNSQAITRSIKKQGQAAQRSMHIQPLKLWATTTNITSRCGSFMIAATAVPLEAKDPTLPMASRVC